MSAKLPKDAQGNESDPDERAPAKELALRLHVSLWTMYATTASGFIMPFGKATYNEAMQWHRERPKWMKTKTEDKTGQVLAIDSLKANHSRSSRYFDPSARSPEQG